MTDQKHTPGPWTIVRKPSGGRIRPTTWVSVFAGRTPVIIADSYTRTSDGETECYHGVKISDADIELIANAPQLLAERDTLRSRVAELEGLLREAQTEIVASVEHSHCHRVYVDGVGADQLADRIDDALEASGIDTANVKEKA